MLDRYFSSAARYLSQENLPAANFYCREGLKIAPKDPALLNLMAAIVGVAGATDVAINYVKRALREDPKFKPAQDNFNALRNIKPVAPRAMSNGFVLIKAWGYGFWSDVSHVLGGVLLAEITGRIPVIHWGSNSLFANPSGDDAFHLFFEPASRFTIEDLLSLKTATHFPDKWNRETLKDENRLKWSGKGSRLGGINFISQRETVLINDFFFGIPDIMPFIPPKHDLYGKPMAFIFSKMIEKYLRPVRPIQEAIDQFFLKHLTGCQTVAVHVRGSDKMGEVLRYTACLSPLEQINDKYFPIIDNFPPTWRIFLLTDDARLIDVFCARYGERIVMTQSQRTTCDTGVHYLPISSRFTLGAEVMLDTYLATRADAFIGNGRSNVSAIIDVMRQASGRQCVLIEPNQLYEETIGPYIST